MLPKQSKHNKGKRPVLVAVFAHPDDESFGPSGTIAKFTKTHDVYLICATKGESGMGPKSNLAQIRAQELKDSANVLGVKKVYFLGFKDGTLSNSLYHKLAAKIEEKIKQLKPQTIITVEPQGVSGHIDHITVSMVTSYVFQKSRSVETIMYYCIDERAAAKMKNYFIYFPPGYKRSQVDKIINIEEFWPLKKKAMLSHKSQKEDAETVLERMKDLPKEEYFLIKKK